LQFNRPPPNHKTKQNQTKPNEKQKNKKTLMTVTGSVVPTSSRTGGTNLLVAASRGGYGDQIVPNTGSLTV
jgi:hypothetical protein